MAKKSSKPNAPIVAGEAPPSQFDLTSVGGFPRHRNNLRPLTYGINPPDADDKNVVWDFGWVSPDLRTRDEAHAHDRAINLTIPFEIKGRQNLNYGEDKKALLYECWKDPRAIKAMKFGKVYPGTHQLTGSCVGAGGGNYLYSLACVEMIRLNEPEVAKVPFWLLPYGRSRFYLGDRSPGEGSLGSTFARAVLEDGVIPADEEGLNLPSYTSDDGLVWGRNAELSWSDGDEKKTMDLLPKSRQFVVKSCAQINNADQARDAIVAGYPFGFCGDWGGLMQCEVKGTPPVLMSRRATTWNHQQSCHAWWDHPELGEIFYVLNQWGLRTHGICPTGAPPGGYWIARKDMEYQCRNGECMVPSQFNGFPAPDWDIPWVW